MFLIAAIRVLIFVNFAWPLQVMIPRQEAALEVAPWTQQFEAVINASAACLWKHIDNWSSDYSWVMGAKVCCTHDRSVSFQSNRIKRFAY